MPGFPDHRRVSLYALSIRIPCSTSRRRRRPGSPYFTPRNEITLAANAEWGAVPVQTRSPGATWRTTRWLRWARDAIYEDECFILDFKFYRRYTSLNGDSGSTTLLIQLTFKTIGQFGFQAL